MKSDAAPALPAPDTTMENEMLIPVTLAGIFTALAVLGVLRRNPLFVRLGYFLFGGMIVTFNVLGLLAGEAQEGGIMEIMSIGIFLCQTIIAYPVVPADVDFNHPAIKTMGLRITMTLMIINATAVWLVLSMPEAPPAIVAAFHGILALIMGMRLVMIATGQNPPVHK